MKLEKIKSSKIDIGVIKCLDCGTKFEYSTRKLKVMEELKKSHNLACEDRQKILRRFALDHIMPHSMKDDNFKECWALENLRPLSAKQNHYDSYTKIRHVG